MALEDPDVASYWREVQPDMPYATIIKFEVDVPVPQIVHQNVNNVGPFGLFG